jgi:ABC-2 type transport system permease protein
MKTIFRFTFTRMIGQILGWGLSFGLLSWYVMVLYDTFINQGTQYFDFIKSYPPELMAFFGDMTKILSPGGLLDTSLFSYGVMVLGIFSILAGSGLLASDEESGKLDLIQAHPISRSALFLGRFFGLTAATAAILILVWCGFAIGYPSAKSFTISLAEIGFPFMAMFAELILFGSFALWLSMILPSRTIAASTAGIVLVVSYFISSLSRVMENLKKIDFISPLHYYQGGFAVDGLNWSWFIGLLLIAGFFTLAALNTYQHRDLRVSGERNWRIPGFTK